MPGNLLLLELCARLLVVLIAVALIWLGAARMPGSASTRNGTAVVLSIAVIGWAVLARGLGISGVYRASNDAIPLVLLGVFAPILIVAAALSVWRAAAELVASIPVPALIAAQVYRVAGVIFVLLWAAGDLPWQFALPAGLGDIATGLAGIPIALRVKQQAPGAARAARLWCLFGIGDLILAITLGGLTSPGRVHLLAMANPNLLVSTYPLVMIPTFAVPLALMLHFAVLRRLPRIDRPAAGRTGERRAASAG